MAHMGAWPALLGELRAQMEAGVDARVREAFMHEPICAWASAWDQMQGYLVGKPVAFEEMSAMIRNAEKRSTVWADL